MSDAAYNEEEADNADVLALFTEQDNLIDYIENVDEIGLLCMRGLAEDESSEADWSKEIKEIRDLIGYDTSSKTYPWPDASNIKYPLVLTAALQFNARAYSTIINNGNIALAKVIGEDPDGEKQARGDRISQHMSFQLTEEMDEWDADMDKLLLGVALDGCCFKKIYFDKALGRNVSEYVIGTDFIVNNSTTSLATCPRMSHVIPYYPHEVQDYVLMEIWEDPDLDREDGSIEPEEFIEQHTYLDVVPAGESESLGMLVPFIVTFVRKTGKVVRIKANYDLDDIVLNGDEVVRVNKKQYFVKYECFPDPLGGFKGKGFGQLLLPINESVNSTLNILMDAGHLANTGGGFMANSFRVSSGALRFSPGEWKKVDVSGMAMKDAIMPLPVGQPSAVLFNLLGLLIDAGKEIASIQDVMTGGGSTSAAVGTTLALIEQGMKVYTSIFKRIYRSLRDELRLLYNLNTDYLQNKNYQNVLDDPRALSQQDYEEGSFDVVPAADPNMATDVQKAAQAQALSQFIGNPMINQQKIMEDILRSIGIAKPEEYIAPPPEGPTPEQLEKLVELKNEGKKIRNDTIKTITDGVVKLQKVEQEGGDAIVNGTELFLLLKQLANDGVIEDEEATSEQGAVSAMEGNALVQPVP